MSGYCACGHAVELHQHGRAGTDCSICECFAFVRASDAETPDVAP